MKAKYWINSVVSIGVYSTLIFLGAGTIRWLQGWLYAGSMVILSIVTLKVLVEKPKLLEERFLLPIQKGQKNWDKVFHVILLPMYYLWLPLNGIDAVRYQWSHMPWQINLLGAIGLTAAFYIFRQVFKANPFAIQVVKIQKQQGQHVITTGPYAHVRHPMYTGAILMFSCGSLLMGSWYGFALGVCIAMLYVIRTAMEDKLLQQELQGYADYKQKVKYRLIPKIW
jgi:protein-S-isoprenylcysteine O-methyltransferase Ste14